MSVLLTVWTLVVSVSNLRFGKSDFMTLKPYIPYYYFHLNQTHRLLMNTGKERKGSFYKKQKKKLELNRPITELR